MDAKARVDYLTMINIPISNKIPELEIALNAVIAASDIVLEIYHNKFEYTSKNDGSPLTAADLNSNKILKEFLSKTGHQILSEEDVDKTDRLNKDTIWIIDPLDGTADFVDKTGEFTIMVSLVQKKLPIIGVIGWPVKKEFYIAQKESGVLKFDTKSWSSIKVSDVSDLYRCSIIGSRHHLSDADKSFIESLRAAQFTSIGSSLKAVKISSGKADAYITTTTKMKEWDTAAAHCIVYEAGGRMTDMSGNELTYNNANVSHNNGILVTNGIIHDNIVQAYQRL